jgi:succinate dehydrogenase / fumarate reductase, cytochrome b subunit
MSPAHVKRAERAANAQVITGLEAVAQNQHRVVFLNLAQIGMPVGAVTSILHRISGVLLALVIPVVAWLLARSLEGPEGYAGVAGWLGQPVVKLAAVLWVWSLAHHVLAGIRHMLTDIDIGSRLRSGRRSAWAVNVAGVVIALLAAGALW